LKLETSGLRVTLKKYTSIAVIVKVVLSLDFNFILNPWFHLQMLGSIKWSNFNDGRYEIIEVPSNAQRPFMSYNLDEE
jgi:hypothetical protein